MKKTDGGDNESTKSKYYKQGLKAVNDEDWQTALNNFNRVYVLDNSFRDVQAMMKKAKNKVATTSKNGTIEIYYQKGLDYFSDENWLYALINFEKVNMLDPNYKEVAALITQARQSFEGNDAIAEANPLSSGKTSPILIIGIILGIFIPFWAMVLLSPTARAKFYLLQKKYDKAGQIYERMLHNNPTNVKLYMTLANIYMNENRTDEYAINIFKKAIESDLNDKLKRRLVPILNQHYLEQGEINDSQIGLLEDSLKEELKNMGN